MSGEEEQMGACRKLEIAQIEARRKNKEIPLREKATHFLLEYCLHRGKESVRKSIGRQQGFMKVLELIDDNKLSE